MRDAAADAARGLHHLHAGCSGRVFVHADVKPANLLYRRAASGSVDVKVSAKKQARAFVALCYDSIKTNYKSRPRLDKFIACLV